MIGKIKLNDCKTACGLNRTALSTKVLMCIITNGSGRNLNKMNKAQEDMNGLTALRNA